MLLRQLKEDQCIILKMDQAEMAIFSLIKEVLSHQIENKMILQAN